MVCHKRNADLPITFHVKAHQNYAAMGSCVPSSQRKGIDLKELLVYEVLEHIGVGPKVHFITHQASEDRAFDKNALFIAAQEVAYTKTPRRISGAEETTGAAIATSIFQTTQPMRKEKNFQ